MKNILTFFKFIFVCAAVFATTSFASAQTWNPGVDANVNVASSWTPATVPGPADTATFGVNFPYFATLPGITWNIANLDLVAGPSGQQIRSNVAPSTINISGNINHSSAQSLVIRNGAQPMDLNVGGDISLTGGGILHFGFQGAPSTSTGAINNVSVAGQTNVGAGSTLRIGGLLGTMNLGTMVVDGTFNPISGNITATNGTLDGGTNVISVSSLSGSGSITGNKITATLPTTGLISVNGATSTTFSSLISDGLANNITALTKDGTSTLTLTGNNTYTGVTTINNGVLELNGAGNIGSSVLSFGVTDTTNGTLRINNGYTFSGTLDLALASVTSTLNMWTLFDGTGFAPGDISLAGITTDIVGLSFTESGGIWTGIDPSNRTWTFNSNTGILIVPEPSQVTLALLIALLLGLGIRYHRHRIAR